MNLINIDTPRQRIVEASVGDDVVIYDFVNIYKYVYLFFIKKYALGLSIIWGYIPKNL